MYEEWRLEQVKLTNLELYIINYLICLYEVHRVLWLFEYMEIKYFFIVNLFYSK